MAIKIERSRYQSQPIQVVKYGNMASSANQIANAWGNISSTFFKEAANVAQQKGEEEARKLTNEQLTFYNEDTNSFENLKAPKHFGSIGAQAYENLARKRFYQSIDNDLKAKSSELFALHSQKPNGAGIIESQFQDYIAKIHKNAGDDNEYANYVKDVGVAYLGNISTRMLQLNVETQKKKNLEAFGQEYEDAKSAIANINFNDPDRNQKTINIIANINSMIGDLANSYSEINGDLLQKTSVKELALISNVQELKNVYSNENNAQLQDDINQALTTRTVSKDSNLPEQIQNTLKSILDSNPTQQEINSIKASIANITTDIKNLSTEELFDITNEFSIESNNIIKNAIDRVTEGVNVLNSKSLEDLLFDDLNFDNVYEKLLKQNSNFANLTTAVYNSLKSSFDSQVNASLISNWTQSLKGLDKEELKMSSMYIGGQRSLSTLQQKLKTSSNITKVDISNLSKIKDVLSKRGGQGTLDSAATQLNSTASQIPTVSTNSSYANALESIVDGTASSSDTNVQTVMNDIIRQTAGINPDVNMNVFFRNPASVGAEVSNQIINTIASTGHLPLSLVENWNNFKKINYSNLGENNVVAYDTLSKWWVKLSNNEETAHIINNMYSSDKKASIRASLDWFSSVQEFLSESDPNYNDQIASAFDQLLQRNTNEGYKSILAEKIDMNFTGKPPSRNEINKELRDLVEEDLNNMLGDSAVPDPYIYNYATSYVEFLLMHKKDGVYPNEYSDVREQLVKQLSLLIDPATHLMILPESRGKFQLLSFGLANRIGKAKTKRLLTEIETEVAQIDPSLEGVQFDSLDLWQSINRIDLNNSLSKVLEIAGQRRDLIIFDSQSIVSGLFNLFSDKPDDTFEQKLMLKPVDTGDPGDMIFSVVLRKTYADGKIIDLDIPYTEDGVEKPLMYNVMDFKDLGKPTFTNANELQMQFYKDLYKDLGAQF